MKNKSNIIYSTIAGNVLEYYDFIIYSFFAKEIGAEFFSSQDSFSQLILSLLVFIVGFAARPLGGVIFGYIGDKYGRKTSLLISIFTMAFATLSMGMLPGYKQIGIYASIALFVLRIVQGLCLAGEGVGAAIFALEHLKFYRSGLIGGIIAASNNVGILLGLAVSIIFHNIFSLYFNEYIWRAVFIFGGVVGLIGAYIRVYIPETELFLEMHRDKDKRLSFKNLVTNNFLDFIKIFLLGGITGALTYFIVSYLPIYLTNDLKIASDISLFYIFIAIISNIIFLPFFGHISDIIGVNKIYTYSNIVILIFIFPILASINNAIENRYIMFLLIVLGIITASVCGPSYKYMTELLEPRIRFTGVAFGFNLGIALLASPISLITIYLTKQFSSLQGVFVPSFYIAFLALLNLLMLVIRKKTFNLSNLHKHN